MRSLLAAAVAFNRLAPGLVSARYSVAFGLPIPIGVERSFGRPSAVGAVLTAAALFYIVFVMRTSFLVEGARTFTLVDDAMISMRYARHFAGGHGLVWNIGDTPIEGFTNLGWTLYMALLHGFSPSGNTISLLVMISGGLCLLATAKFVYQIALERMKSGSDAALAAALLTAFYFPLVFWSLRGMEVGLVVLLVYAATAFTLRLDERSGAGLFWVVGAIMGLAVWVRFDVLPQTLLLCLYAVASCSANPKQRVRSFALTAAVMTSAAAVLAFQYGYFASALPNTYHLKVEGVAMNERLGVGWFGLSEYAARDVLLPALIVAVGLLAVPALRTRVNMLLVGMFGVQVAYSVYVGGDYADVHLDSANRFIAQGMPALFLLFAAAATALFDKFRHASPGPLRSVSVAVLTLAVISGPPWLAWIDENAPMLDSDQWRLERGLEIARFSDEDAVIAVHAAGQIPYYAERRTLDLLGKSDPFVARGTPSGTFRPGHNKWNYDYSVAGLRPDIVADEWGSLRTYMSERRDYVRLPNGVYLRADSERLGVVLNRRRSEAAAEAARLRFADAPSGLWSRVAADRARPVSNPTPEQAEQMRLLAAIGYVQGSSPDPQVSGVTVHEPDGAFAGFNLYTSGHAPEAILMDMDGRALHRWHRSWRDVWPGAEAPVDGDNHLFWRRAQVFPNGDLLAIFEGIGLVKLDVSSNLLWAYPGEAHHDLLVEEDGSILVLSREARIDPRIHDHEPILEDFVAVLDANGRELRRVSILDAVLRSGHERALEKLRKHGPGDLLHTNTLEVVDERLAARLPAVKPGQVLLSILRLDLIAVLDLETGEFPWMLDGDFRSQHQPTVVDGGHILLFDNLGLGDRSRLLEIDPSDGAVRWQYGEQESERFFSRTCGSQERLLNGNTLVTESNAGRAFEVDARGEVVWEFYNPHLTDDGKYVATLFEVVRLPPSFPTQWARGLDAPAMPLGTVVASRHSSTGETGEAASGFR